MASLFDLSTFLFSNQSDIVLQNATIVNPFLSNIQTLDGDDQIVSNALLVGDFGFQVIANANTNGQNSLMKSFDTDSLIQQAIVDGNGIVNRGIISLNDGQDLFHGYATANLSTTVEVVAQAIAVASSFSANSIANALGIVDFQAIADGIDNSGGEVHTNDGDDRVGSDILGNLTAVAIATADASAIIEAIATLPMSEGLEAFAEAVAINLTNATITATGINNQRGIMTTGAGSDHINSMADTFNNAIGLAFANAMDIVHGAPESNQALALATADAFLQITGKSIAINNTDGYIHTGDHNDIIDVKSRTIGIDNTRGYIGTGNHDDKIIVASNDLAIQNTGGLIDTGSGNDHISVEALNSAIPFSIVGGKVSMGPGNDKFLASKLAGNVEISLGDGHDYVEGFGAATLLGGNGFDALGLRRWNYNDFDSIKIAGQNVYFSLDGQRLRADSFEQFTFANGATYSFDNLPHLGSNERDFCQGRETADFMDLRAGDDVANGRGGADYILGREGNDVLWGGDGHDVIDGGADDDLIFGGVGKDILDGGLGTDTLKGGAGTDHFVISGEAAESDLILDYQDGFDKLKLTSGLTLNNITINQRGHSTVINDAFTHETYAIVLGIDASHIDASDFIIA